MAKTNIPKSVLSDKERKLNNLALGFVKPVTEADKRLAKEIKEIQDKGRIVEIPPEIV